MAQLKDLIVNGASRFIGTLFADTAQITTLNAPTSSNGTTYGPGTDGQVLKSNGSSLYWAAVGGASSYNVTDRNTATALSSSGTGLVTERTVYYGLPIINNAHNYTSSTTIYAPTAGGTADTQALVGNGTTTAPKWVNISPSISITAGTSSAAPKINTTVLGQSGTAASITTATTGVYGVTKLSSTASSSEQGLAATPKLVYDSIAAITTTVSNTWTAGTSNGPTLSTTVNGVTGTAVAIPSAAAGASGVVTTGTQQFDGNKTFKGHIYAQANDTYNIGANNIRWSNGYFTSGFFGYYAATSGGGVSLHSNAAQYGRWYVNTIGTASDGTTQGAQGEVYLTLGNSTARAGATETTGANNARGRIRLYGTNQYYVDFIALDNTANRTTYIPSYAGTMYFTHTSGTSAVGSTTQPVYVAANGRITAITGSIANSTTGSAATLTTGRTLKVSLGSTSASTAFNGSANITDIGVSGTLGIGNGGTGKTTWDIYKIVYASAANTLGQLGHASSTSYLLKSGSSSAAPSWIQYTNSNTASTIVSRDASGNFAGATITATTFTGNLNKKLDLKYDGTESTTNVSFNNSADITFSLAGFVRGVDDSSIVTPSGSYLTLSGGTMTGSLIASNATSTRQVRNITYSTSAPTSSDGQVGDIWLVYTS